MIIGVDPGKTGAIAFVNKHGAAVEDTPDTPQAMAELIRARRGDALFAYIEQVHSMPKQGVASTFTFGCGYGVWQGIFAALLVPVTFVRPQEWKKWHRLLNTDKDVARTRACELFPYLAPDMDKKKHIGRADALLIAAYGLHLHAETGRVAA